MAEAVVVRLEAVEVEEREDPWVGPGLGELREVLHELAAVGETGQGIGAGLRPPPAYRLRFLRYMSTNATTNSAV